MSRPAWAGMVVTVGGSPLLGAASTRKETTFSLNSSAEIAGATSRALDPLRYDADAARLIAKDLCEALTDSYDRRGAVRPETLAVAVQTVLETLLCGVEREGVDAASMRVALANSMLVNGRAEVRIMVDGKPTPSLFCESGARVH